jgi:molybdopterin molybdotransferase
LPRLKGFEKLTNIEEAFSVFSEKLKAKRLKSVQIPVGKAFGRILAIDVKADHDLPRSDRSAVDGYAAKAQNTFEASQFNPKRLGLTEHEQVHENEARQIWTGNPLPPGADTVVMLEHTRRIRDGIEVLTPFTLGENVSKRGEDVRKYEIAIKDGTRLKPHHIGLLAALGLTHVSVVEKPEVAVLSTGNELVDLSCRAELNQLVDVNRLIISCMCSELGVDTVDLGIAKDDIDEISARILKGLEEADVVIVTGGTSVGQADLVPAAVNKVGEPGVVVHGVAMRPGMPTGLAILLGKPVFMLPGNPVAAMIGFEVFVRPLLFQLLGIENEPRPTLKAKLTHRVASALGRRVFLRVRVYERDNEFFADPIRIKGSGILSTMTKANGYVIIPGDCEGLEEGESVIVHLFDKVVVA